MTLHKAPEKFCPFCGADITDSYMEEDDPRLSSYGSWYCEACEAPLLDEKPNAK